VPARRRFLNVLSGFISDRERIVTIEDAAELVLRQRHVVRLETRRPTLKARAWSSSGSW
jgi:pilus assembly protein CpaF